MTFEEMEACHHEEFPWAWSRLVSALNAFHLSSFEIEMLPKSSIFRDLWPSVNGEDEACIPGAKERVPISMLVPWAIAREYIVEKKTEKKNGRDTPRYEVSKRGKARAHLSPFYELFSETEYKTEGMAALIRTIRYVPDLCTFVQALGSSRTLVTNLNMTQIVSPRVEMTHDPAVVAYCLDIAISSGMVTPVVRLPKQDRVVFQVIQSWVRELLTSVECPLLVPKGISLLFPVPGEIMYYGYYGYEVYRINSKEIYSARAYREALDWVWRKEFFCLGEETRDDTPDLPHLLRIASRETMTLWLAELCCVGILRSDKKTEEGIMTSLSSMGYPYANIIEKTFRVNHELCELVDDAWDNPMRADEVICQWPSLPYMRKNWTGGGLSGLRFERAARRWKKERPYRSSAVAVKAAWHRARLDDRSSAADDLDRVLRENRRIRSGDRAVPRAQPRPSSFQPRERQTEVSLRDRVNVLDADMRALRPLRVDLATAQVNLAAARQRLRETLASLPKKE